MLTRAETVRKFYDFMRDNDLQISNLLVVAECAMREISARTAKHEAVVDVANKIQQLDKWIY